MRARTATPIFSVFIACSFAAQSAAQTTTVNDRLNNRAMPARSGAEAYVGMTVAQLLVALGLALKSGPAAMAGATEPPDVHPGLAAVRPIPQTTAAVVQPLAAATRAAAP